MTGVLCFCVLVAHSGYIPVFPVIVNSCYHTPFNVKKVLLLFLFFLPSSILVIIHPLMLKKVFYILGFEHKA